MKKTNTSVTKITVFFIFLLVLVVGYYAYLSGTHRTEQQEAVMSEIDTALSRNLENNYPSTPKEVVKYYNDLMKLTLLLTRSAAEAEKLFRLMCFNVFAHNRDDHSKNFSYIYDEDKNNWELAPAYDLTYSNSIGGEHATCINGNGIAPGLEDLLAVAQTGGLNKNKARRTALEIEAIVKADLSDLLKQHSVFS